MRSTTSPRRFRGRRRTRSEKKKKRKLLFMVYGFISIVDGPEEPEPLESEELKNPKAKYRNPKQIRNSNVQKTANKEKIYGFVTFGFVSNFGFRASNLESTLFIGSMVFLLRTFDLKKTNISKDLQQ
jgi:hypothetical protein